MRAHLLLVLALAACGGADEATAPTAAALEVPKDAIVKVTDTGPVKTTLSVWPAKPTLGDPIYARLEIAAPAGVTVDAPFQQAGDNTLGRFRVVTFTRDSATRQTYTLDAPSSGRVRVPPLRLEMIDARPGQSAAAAKPTEILTDEVPLDVAPVKQDQVDATLRGAAGELPTTVGGLSWLAILGLGSAVLVLASGSILLYRGLRAKRRIALQRTAYDEAIARLRDLEARGAPTTEDADRWFVELSAIVRRYLEGRYEIRAPELTTEEFLQTVATAKQAALARAHRELLADFLERCDRVKFAGYRPESNESLGTLTSARAFIEDTRAAGGLA